jgi:flavin-dependent dehydrogenase
MSFDAVVVGAGPGGAFSACWLAKNGLKVLLLEK